MMFPYGHTTYSVYDVSLFTCNGLSINTSTKFLEDTHRDGNRAGQERGGAGQGKSLTGQGMPIFKWGGAG